MSPLEEALALALQLAPRERLQLIEQVASSIERELEPAPQPKTGAEIVAMLESMEPIEFVDPHIEDPVEWVKAQRQKRTEQLKPYWEGDSPMCEDIER